MSITVGVDLGARSYDIHVGRGLLERGGALAARGDLYAYNLLVTCLLRQGLSAADCERYRLAP